MVPKDRLNDKDKKGEMRCLREKSVNGKGRIPFERNILS